MIMFTLKYIKSPHSYAVELKINMLTKGAITQIFSDGRFDSFSPVVQIISIKPRRSGYILLLSDSVHSTEMLYLTHNPLPKLYSLIQIEAFEHFPHNNLVLLLQYKHIHSLQSITGSPMPFIPDNSAKPRYKFTPIKNLSLNSSTWVLKVRVIEKSPVEITENSQGVAFKVLLLDESSDELQAVFFNEAVDIFFTEICEKKMYIISGGRIKLNDRQTKSYKTKFQLVLDKSSRITEIFDDKTIKSHKFIFMDIKSILKLRFGQRVDMCGIIISIHPSDSSLEVQDSSNSSIQIFCSELPQDLSNFSVIVCKNIQYEPNSSILISDSSSHIIINPSGFPEAEALKALSLKTCNSIKSFYTIKEVSNMIISKILPDEIKFLGVISEIICDENSPFWYPACANSEKCSKKVASRSDGFYDCKDCVKSCERFVYRYAIQISVSDSTGVIKLKAFDCVGRMMFGISAEEMVRLMYENKQVAVGLLSGIVGRKAEFYVSAKQIGKSIPISKAVYLNENNI